VKESPNATYVGEGRAVPAKAEGVDVAVIVASATAPSVMIRSQGLLRSDRTLAPEAAEEPEGPVLVIAG
jgi:hypothetical protein